MEVMSSSFLISHLLSVYLSLSNSRFLNDLSVYKRLGWMDRTLHLCHTIKHSYITFASCCYFKSQLMEVLIVEYPVQPSL